MSKKANKCQVIPKHLKCQHNLLFFPRHVELGALFEGRERELFWAKFREQRPAHFIQWEPVVPGPTNHGLGHGESASRMQLLP